MSHAATPTSNHLVQRKKEIALATPEFMQVLPSDVDVEVFKGVVINAIREDAKLLHANQSSFFASCMKAARDGLLCDGKEAALIEYKGVVTYQPMISGIIKKVPGKVDAHLVYEKDEFQYELGLNPNIKHIPYILSDCGEVIGCYAVIRLDDGSVAFDYMRKFEIEDIRKLAPSALSLPWRNHWGEMAKKTVIKRVIKRLKTIPASLQKIIDSDNNLYKASQEQGNNAVEPMQNVSPMSRLKASIGLAEQNNKAEEGVVLPEAQLSIDSDDWPEEVAIAKMETTTEASESLLEK